MSYKATILAALSAFAIGTPALAQEHGGGHSALPEICRTDSPTDSMGSMEMKMPEGMDEAHMALGAGMGMMNSDMAMGMMADDIDVAFICSMIPHHQGAIAMAKAELEHGDDPWAKELAQKVIAAQEQEIKDMIAWLEKQ